MSQFYRDLGRPDVEKLARAICTERGFDPDEHVRETGYDSAALIPCWWKYQDSALDFIAMTKAMGGGS